MALKNIFVKDTRILISWEERFAKVQLVYNDIVAPFKTIVEHWERFESLRGYFKDENASYAMIKPSQFSGAMKIINSLKAEYEANKKMCFIFDEKVENLKVLDTAPDNYKVKYKLSASTLIRELPDKAIECDDGWNVWNNYLWHLPKLSVEELKGFRREKIIKEDLVKFLKQDLPLYRESSLDIDCEIEITNAKALFIEFGQVERDSVELIVDWAVPLDSVDPDFSLFGYVLSNNTIYSGLNPLEIEQYCPDLVGSHVLEKEKIADFLDHVYEKWSPWIVGDTDKFDEIHHWLNPPYYTFLKVDIDNKNGIGHTHAKPYILIGYECLSLEIFKQALSTNYYHLREGWIKSEILKSTINKRIVENPDALMESFDLNQNQVLHQGNKKLSDLWDDILFSDSVEWYEDGTDLDIAFKHFDYLTKWGIDGGLNNGYEGFMAYGVPYLVEIVKKDNLKPIIIIDKKYDRAINITVENIPVLKDAGTDIVYYSELSAAKKQIKHNIAILVEPEYSFFSASDDEKTVSVSNDLYEIMDSCNVCLCFFKSQLSKLPQNLLRPIAELLGTEYPDDVKYLVRNVNGKVESPKASVFPKNLHLRQMRLIYHENKLDLD